MATGWRRLAQMKARPSAEAIARRRLPVPGKMDSRLVAMSGSGNSTAQGQRMR